MRIHWRNFRIPGLIFALASVSAAAQTASPAMQTITLDEAIKRAEANEPAFAAAAAEARAAALEHKDAKAALLPSVTVHSQYLFTESNHVHATNASAAGQQSLPVFIANNAVHEYVGQASFNETVGLGPVVAARLAGANAARAEAELEIARRGLVAAVADLYYSVQASAEKLAIAQRALGEADRFVEITTKRESAGEAAHADVIKARLSQQQRQRELADANLAREKATLELGVLLYPDPLTKFAVEGESALPMLPDRADFESAAKVNNPELRSALAALKAAQAEAAGAWANLLPELTLNYAYGIDATEVASRGPEDARNLGYAASATVDFPVWDWFTSERKVKEAHARAQAAKIGLSATQRRLLAELSEFFDETSTARQQLASLDASVMDAREALRLTTLRYVNGEGTVLDVVDAQNTLELAENARADGSVRFQLALAQLQTLTGRL